MEKKAPRAKCLRSCLQQHSQGRMGPSRAFPDTDLEQEQEMAKKLHLNMEKSHPSSEKKLENGAQALCDWPSHCLVCAGGSCKMGRAGEDHTAITQPPCQGLGASLGAAGSQHIPQRLQLPLDSRQNQLCAPSQERSSLLLNTRLESRQAFPGKQQHRKAQGMGRSVSVTPWTWLGGRAGKHLPSHSHLIMG